MLASAKGSVCSGGILLPRSRAFFDSREVQQEDDQLKVLQKLLASHGLMDFRFGSNKELSESLNKAVKPEEGVVFFA